MRVYVTERGMLEWEYFKELAQKGNLVRTVTLKPNTLILGPCAHRLLPGMEKYAEVAIKSARQQYTPVLKPVKSKVKKVKAPKVKKEGGA